MTLSYEQARDYVLSQARSLGLDVEVVTSATRELTLASFEQELSEITQAYAGGIGLRVVIAGKTGYASTEERSYEALDWALQEAKENAELQTDTGGFLPAARAMGQHDLIGEGLSATVEEKARVAHDLEAQLREDERLKQVMLSRYTEREVTFSLASTQGAQGGYRNGFTGLLASIIMQDGESVKQNWDIAFEKEFHSLNPGQTALEMRENTARLLNARPLKTGRYRAYFEPRPFLSILQLMFFMFSGKTVLEGKSRFATKLGARIAADTVTIIDDPTLEHGMGSRPFDAEGTPAKAVTIVEDGILKSFIHNSATARQLGQENTGHAARSYKGTLNVAPSNFYLQAGKGVSPSDGIIITQVMGLHAGANPITGDFSLQALGLHIAAGESHPVENFAVSGNILELFEKITGLGDKLEWLNMGVALGAPMVEVAELSFGGQ